jgi:hypothetical protein
VLLTYIYIYIYIHTYIYIHIYVTAEASEFNVGRTSESVTLGTR